MTSDVSSGGLTLTQAARRAGVEPEYVEQLVEVGILHPRPDGYTIGDVRRIGLLPALERTGLPLEAMSAGIASGLLSLDFADSPEYERFARLTDETFEDVAERTGIPIALLAILRETVGNGAARPTDLVRTDELRVVPFLEIQVRLGFDPVAIERLLRAIGDSTRRIAEAEAEWWRSQVTDPRLAAGMRGEAIAGLDASGALIAASQEALLAIFNAQQAQTWTGNIAAGFQYLLAKEGLFEAPERPPAICFLDVTGYTRLTQERGDRAAAELAETLARLVKRTSGGHGGRPVKWLGDGVMFYFGEPASAALAALEMVEAVPSAGLPPAHVGVHAGPVVVQEGDYYGQTVNLSARIADYARPGEVLVSRTVVDSAEGAGVASLSFSAIGSVELKGVAAPTELYVAHRAT
jgi:class 3 adenylate cyclase